jgi:hypothetical protein
MPNEIEIHVKVSDNGKASLDKTKATYTAAGRDIGTSTGKAIDDGVKRTQFTPAKIKADNPIDAEWRAQIESSLKTAAKDSLKIPITPESEQFRRDLAGTIDVVRQGLKAEIPVGVADAAKFKEEVQLLAYAVSKGTKAMVDIEFADDDAKKLEEEAQQAADKAGSAATKELEKSAQSISGAFGPLMFAGLAFGLPAAAVIGAAGAGLALSAVPALFVGISAAALKHNGLVTDSFADLKKNVLNSTQTMASSMAGPLTSSIDQVDQSFNRMKPQIQEAINGSAAVLPKLTGAVTDLAENAMPGLVTATEQSSGALDGLRSLTGSVGTGLSQMLTAMASQSNAAGTGMQILGVTIQQLEQFAGRLFANLAQGTGPMTTLQADLGLVEQAILRLTASGSGAIGFLQGFGTAGTGVLSVVNALAGVIGILPPQVTQLAGSVTAASAVLAKFGVDATAGFKGFGKSVSDAEGASGKFSAVVGGLATAAFNPATMAAGALGIGLMILGQAQEKAAAAAQEDSRNQQSLTDALRQSNGVVDASTRAAVVNAEANTKLSDGMSTLQQTAKGLEISQSDLTDALMGVPGAMDKVNAQLDTHVKKTGESVQVTDEFKDAVGHLGGIYNQSTGDAKLYNEAMGKTGDATSNAGPPMSTLATAMKTLSDNTGSAATKASALKTALDILDGRAPVFEDAIKSGNDALRNFTDTIGKGADKAKGFGAALLNADGTINTFTANGSSLQGLAESLETSFTTAASGVQQLTDKGMPLKQAQDTVAASLQVQRDRFITAAHQMGINGQAAIDLANKYGLIPKDVSTSFHGDNSSVVAAFNSTVSLLRGLDGRTATVHITTINGYQNVGINSGMAHSMQAKGSIQGANMMFAGGGLPTPNGANSMSGVAQIVHPGTLKWAGDAKVPEAYIPLDHSSRSMDLLASANRMMAPSSAALGGSSGGAGGGGGGGSANVQISFGLSGVDYVDAIITDIAKSVRSKGGNVQVVLGGSS